MEVAVLSRWPIRNKFRLGLACLLIIVLALFGSAYYGLYAYRDLVRGLSARSTELPLAGELSRIVSDMRVTISEAQGRLQSSRAEQWPAPASAPARWDNDGQLLRQQFRYELEALRRAVDEYRQRLDANQDRSEGRIADDRQERKTLSEITAAVGRLQRQEEKSDWILDEVQLEAIEADADALQELADQLPSYLYARMQVLAQDVRAQYRAAIVVAWVTVGAALLLLSVFVRMFRRWIARPLGTLIDASRDVAAGRFDRRVHLDSQDEMSDLAEAMNAMTGRFEEVKVDLDRKVHERTKQAVRSEQLASVGFLAAGVAHEINNPLASIAMCSESLESRLAGLMRDDEESAGEREVVASYLRMIQEESFRCKGITERLLDFARIGDTQRHSVDLYDVVAGVIDMVCRLGKYHEKHLVLTPGEPVVAHVNPQEMKQIVLNLVTNGLDSVERGGTVTVTVDRHAGAARITVVDNGCGMTREVIDHLFEPFFTRRIGGQGTGLGLAITYRIVEEHQGTIEASSEGTGRGSRFTVRLPLAANTPAVSKDNGKEARHHFQAA
jgi:signal transduction histidine kinase